MMCSSPLVTVYLPTRNRLSLLRRAVDSVLSQDYANVELVVVDDGSSDGTTEYLAARAVGDDRLRVLWNDENQGACRSRNAAIAAARGEFVTGLDDDDYFEPWHIASLVNCWGKRRGDNVVALYPDARVIGSDGAHQQLKRRPMVTQRALVASNAIGNQIFAKRTEWLRVGGFSDDLPAWQDLECWYRLLAEGRVAQCTGECTYVMDTSHGYERITTSGLERIHDAYTKFIARHALRGVRRGALFTQLLAYRLKSQDGPLLNAGRGAFRFVMRRLF